MDDQQPEPQANSGPTRSQPACARCRRGSALITRRFAPPSPWPSPSRPPCARRHDANGNARDGISDRHLIDMACIPDGPAHACSPSCRPCSTTQSARPHRRSARARLPMDRRWRPRVRDRVTSLSKRARGRAVTDARAGHPGGQGSQGVRAMQARLMHQVLRHLRARKTCSSRRSRPGSPSRRHARPVVFGQLRLSAARQGSRFSPMRGQGQGRGEVALVERLETEAQRRAVEGWDEPVFHEGREVGKKRRYSDTLLIFTLKAWHRIGIASGSRSNIRATHSMASPLIRSALPPQLIAHADAVEGTGGGPDGERGPGHEADTAE